MKYFALLAILALAACGASGAPVKPGMTINGTVAAGVATHGS